MAEVLEFTVPAKRYGLESGMLDGADMDGTAQVAAIHLVDRSVDPALVTSKTLNIQNGDRSGPGLLDGSLMLRSMASST
jgi:hypothetical protein